MELLFAAPELHHRPSSAIAAKPAAATATPLADVVAALEHATFAARRLSSASAAGAVDASLALLALASLRSAHHMIGSFLAQVDAADGGDEEPMPDRAVAGEDGATEATEGSTAVEEVEEMMREWVLWSKRQRKRLAPPSWTTGRVDDLKAQTADPIDRRRWAIDLVFQFHG